MSNCSVLLYLVKPVFVVPDTVAENCSAPEVGTVTDVKLILTLTGLELPPPPPPHPARQTITRIAIIAMQDAAARRSKKHSNRDMLMLLLLVELAVQSIICLLKRPGFINEEPGRSCSLSRCWRLEPKVVRKAIWIETAIRAVGIDRLAEVRIADYV